MDWQTVNKAFVLQIETGKFCVIVTIEDWDAGKFRSDIRLGQVGRCSCKILAEKIEEAGRIDFDQIKARMDGGDLIDWTWIPNTGEEAK